LFPQLRFDVYDNPASPDANFFLPRKKISQAAPSPPPPPPSTFGTNRTGISTGETTGRYVNPFEPTVFRWELEDDESGIQALGQMVTTINDLSDFITLYFCVQGLVLLLMVVQLLKLFEFQKHLNITSKTLSRAGPDLLHFMVIFFFTLTCSAMVAHLMLGSLEETFSTITNAFNFHFEIILGESLGIFAALLTNKSVVRTTLEDFTLVFYSFFAPLFIILLMVNVIFGILADAFGTEKDDLREANEPTVRQDLTSYFRHNRKVLTFAWPTYGSMLTALGRVRRKPEFKETAAQVLGKHIKWRHISASAAEDDSIREDGPSRVGIASAPGLPPLSSVDAPSDVKSHVLAEPATAPASGAEIAFIDTLPSDVVMPVDSTRMNPLASIRLNPLTSYGLDSKERPGVARWGKLKGEHFAEGLKAEKPFLWGGLNIDDMLVRLAEMDKSKQVEMGHKVGGLGLVAEMLNVIQDSDSDSDSDVDDSAALRGRVRGKVKGQSSAWSVIKKYTKVPSVHDDWQGLIDDVWGEYMYDIKRLKAEADDVSSLHTEEGEVFTVQEIDAFLQMAELRRRRKGSCKKKAPTPSEVADIVKSVIENKVQQYPKTSVGYDVLVEKEKHRCTQEAIVKTVKKLNAFVMRELMLQKKTEAWNLRMESAIEAHEFALTGLYEVLLAAKEKFRILNIINPAADDGKSGNTGEDQGEMVRKLLSDPATRAQLRAVMNTKVMLRDAMNAIPVFELDLEGIESEEPTAPPMAASIMPTDPFVDPFAIPAMPTSTKPTPAAKFTNPFRRVPTSVEPTTAAKSIPTAGPTPDESAIAESASPQEGLDHGVLDIGL
jgi:hypothetical protein